MLPDLQPFRTRLDTALTRSLEARSRQLSPILEEVNRAPMYEGERTGVERPGEVNEFRALNEAVAEVVLSNEEVERFTPASAAEKLESMAEQMSRDISKMLIGLMEEATEKSGNVIDAKGKPFSFDVMMEALAAMPIEFDESTGQPVMSVMLHPSAMKNVEKMWKDYSDNPEQQKRHRELLEKKREEWRVRTAGRRLVG